MNYLYVPIFTYVYDSNIYNTWKSILYIVINKTPYIFLGYVFDFVNIYTLLWVFQFIYLNSPLYFIDLIYGCDVKTWLFFIRNAFWQAISIGNLLSIIVFVLLIH